LSNKGNTILIIEHNIDILKIVDYVVELGPAGGENGGNIIFQGLFDDFIKNKKSITSLFVKKELNLNYAQ
jgi:excinuclease ABC subunit A